MFRILYSDTRKLLHDKGFLVCLLLTIVYPLFSAIVLKIIAEGFMHRDLTADDVCFSYQSFAIFLVTASTLLVTSSEYTDGCIRNKIISGAKRSEVFLSSVICGMLHGILLSACAFLGSLLMRLTLTKPYTSYSIPEIADFWLVTTFACMAIGVFSTMLVMLMGGKKIAFIAGLAIATAMKFISMEVLDKLYPSAGSFSKTGTKLKIYELIDRFVPYAYLGARPHYAFSDYLIGCGGLILLSALIGLIVFEKKELQ